MFTPPNNSSVMGKVPKSVLGVAGGILNMSRTLGMGLGVTLGGLSYQIFLSVFGNNQVDIIIYSFRSSYFVVAILSFITLMISVIFCNSTSMPSRCRFRMWFRSSSAI